jgi:hypothetical protein
MRYSQKLSCFSKYNGEEPDTTEFSAAFYEAFKSVPNKKLSGGFGVNAHGFDEAWVRDARRRRPHRLRPLRAPPTQGVVSAHHRHPLAASAGVA